MTPPEEAARIERLLAHREWVRGLARRLVRSDSDADDLAQETWVAALRAPPDGRGSERGWLQTVLRNAARLRHRGDVRRGRREETAARPEAQPAADEIVSRAEEHRRVVDAVLQLDEPYRTTALLRFYDELPPREVARRTGVPVETARARIRRALGKLRSRLDDAHGGDGESWRRALLPLAGLRIADLATAGAAETTRHAGSTVASGPGTGTASATTPASTTASTTGSAATSTTTSAGATTAGITSLTTGAVLMAKATVVAAGVALAAGAAIGWFAGGDARSEVADLRARVEQEKSAAATAGTAVTQATETVRRRDGRISELEAELKKVRAATADAEQRATKLSEDLAVAREQAAKLPGAGAAPQKAKISFAFPEFGGAMDEVDWDSVALHTTAIVGPIREIADAVLAGTEIPLAAAGEAQKHNGPLIQAVAVLNGRLSGTGPNGAYTHPAFMVNALAAALTQIGKPLSDAQRASFEQLGRRFTEEERKRVASYTDDVFQMRRLAEEGALKDRFFDEVRVVLTKDQLDALSPEAVRDRCAADLWSEGLLWATVTRPVPYTDRAKFGDAIVRTLGPLFKLDDAQKAKLPALVAGWDAALPSELMSRKPDALERMGMSPADLVGTAATATADLVERVARELNLTGDALAAAKRWGVVFYPLPSDAAADDE